MTAKTRSNYCIPFCTRADCTNRGASCGVCMMYSMYAKPAKLEVLKDDQVQANDKQR